MRDVLHELVDAVAGLKGITGRRQAELHAQLREVPEPAPEPAPKPAPKPAPAPKSDDPAGA